MIIDPSTFTLSAPAPFVVFEGINGCGKTTLLTKLERSLADQNIPHRTTREPGGTPLGTEIRKLLLEWEGEPKDPRTELLLFAADRAEHIEKVVRPAKQEGEWLLCDRFIYSTIAFQGYGRGLSRTLIDEANNLAIGETTPDLVILLDIDPVVAAKRMANRSDNGRDSFEDEALAFHRRIRDGFLEIASSLPTPFLVLDAELTPDELLRTVEPTLGIKN